MRLTISTDMHNVGREDRLVRGAVALSLLLIGAFVVLASGALGATSILFGALVGYFLLTAALGWDPLYAKPGIDTRTDAERLEHVVDEHVIDEYLLDEHVIDLRQRIAAGPDPANDVSTSER
jgi:hypothetical protein